MNVLDFKLFVETRLSDVVTIIGDKTLFEKQPVKDDDFLKFKTISKRVNNNKIRLSLTWNHSLKHDLIKRFHERTNLQTIHELNSLLSKGLDELFTEHFYEIRFDGRYALWFSEYNISIIIDTEKEKDHFNILTIVHGIPRMNEHCTIELKSKI